MQNIVPVDTHVKLKPSYIVYIKKHGIFNPSSPWAIVHHIHDDGTYDLFISDGMGNSKILWVTRNDFTVPRK